MGHQNTRAKSGIVIVLLLGKAKTLRNRNISSQSNLGSPQFKEDLEKISWRIPTIRV